MVDLDGFLLIETKVRLGQVQQAQQVIQQNVVRGQVQALITEMVGNGHQIQYRGHSWMELVPTTEVSLLVVTVAVVVMVMHGVINQDGQAQLVVVLVVGLQ
jgi:hypothetical protein